MSNSSKSFDELVKEVHTLLNNMNYDSWTKDHEYVYEKNNMKNDKELHKKYVELHNNLFDIYGPEPDYDHNDFKYQTFKDKYRDWMNNRGVKRKRVKTS